MDKLPVTEIFGPTLAGEGSIAGQVSFFVRFFGCGFRCTWCFGVLPGRRIPRVITSREPNKQLPDVKIGDKLLTFDANNTLVETTVMDVGSRDVDRWLRIKIQGKTYFVTEEHPFFTTRGLVAASDLCVGDMILHASPSDKISWSKRGDANPMKRADVAARSGAAQDREKASSRMKETQRRRKAQGLPVGFAAWSPEKRDALAAQLSADRKGENNPNWQGGISHPNFVAAKERIKGKELPCDRCNNVTKLEVHHKDEDYTNDNDDNFEFVCHPCHSKEHRRGYNFWQSPRKDGKSMAVADGEAVPKNGMEVQAIKLFDRLAHPYPSTRPAPLRVYNLTCAPHNSYLADYMWVHNCDSMHSVDPKNYKENAALMDEETILSKLLELDARGQSWITITGGDPLIHDLATLCKKLKNQGFRIAVETQGSIYADWLTDCDLVTCSPKGPTSGMMNRLDNRVLHKYVTSLGRRLVFKIVSFGAHDLEFAASITQTFPGVPLYLTSGTHQHIADPSPLAVAPAVLDGYRALIEGVLIRPKLHHATLLPQLHVLVWGAKQGH
jgi:7-carboxy-7-deazaguanine synthase